MKNDIKAMYSSHNRVGSFSLRGVIGQDFNGHLFADAITDVAKSMEVDEIEIHINSEGGSVMQGLSIVDSILNSPVTVTTIVSGVAASMAGVIAVCGDKVKMVDYGRIMIHNPHMGSYKPNAKEQKGLDELKGTLVNIFETRGNSNPELVSSLMDEETWLDKGKAIDLGLVDPEDIISTGRVVDFTSFDTITEMVACANNINKKANKMEKVLNHLKLDSSTDESGVLNAITSLETVNASLTNENSELKRELATNVVDSLIEKGTLEKENREALIEARLSNKDTFDALVKSFKKPVPVVNNLINTGENKKDDSIEVNSIEDLKKVEAKFGSSSEEYIQAKLKIYSK